MMGGAGAGAGGGMVAVGAPAAGGGAGMGGGGAGMGGGGAGMGGGGAGGGGMMCMAGGAGMGGAMGGMGGMMGNLHIFHANAVNTFRCNLCHIAVPHGWKNKVLLVNLNDVGPEVGLPVGTQVRYVAAGAAGPAPGYLQGPYYNRAALKVVQFGVSGQWQDTFCGSAGPPGNGIQGVMWMAGSNEACVALP